MSSTSVLEAQIAALVQRLEETKEAEQWENECKEVEAAAKRAHLEEECRMREEQEAQAAREQCNAEERRLEQERQEEAQWRESCQETSLSPEASPVLELPHSKGKEPEVAPESDVMQESWRCNSCVKRNAECIRIKVIRHW